MPNEPPDSGPKKRRGRALLVAAVGVAAVQLAACGPQQPVGNLSVGDFGPVDATMDAPIRYDVVGNLDIGIAPDVVDAADAADASDANDAATPSDVDDAGLPDDAGDATSDH